MKIPESWLYEWVHPTESLTDVAHQLTMVGLEIEQISPVAEPFIGVVVAEVMSKERHPNADRLSVCQVNIGQEALVQIVCGAPNVEAGLKVPCALPGAILPGNFKIKQSKIRDVASSGMLCSSEELGMPSDVDGLWILPADAPVGKDIRDVFNLDENILTLKITPNRGDCLSIKGLAREVSAITKTALTPPISNDITETTSACLDVQIAPNAIQACPLYATRVFENLNLDAKTPDWMVNRLVRAGLRAIHPIVDITNYVMLELGQPLHAFDLDKIDGGICVRFGDETEKLKLLNETEVTCWDLLVIADSQKPLALGGVMGGFESGVTQKTTRILLEAAYFDPTMIAKAARQLGIDSDAAYRFERGVDFGQTLQALQKASELIVEICGGQTGPVAQAAYSLPIRPPIGLRLSRLNRILGNPFTVEQVTGILDQLQFDYTLDQETIVVRPPTYRFDITMEIDLIEEIARIYGYENISVPSPAAPLTMLASVEEERSLYDLKTLLVSQGFYEAINFSFIDEDIEKTLLENEDAIKIVNPIASHLTVMRSSLIGSLMLDLINNLSRKQSRVRLFEVGRCFVRTQEKDTEIPGITQPIKISALAYGPAVPEQWGETTRNIDFFDMKGIVESLLSENAVCDFKPMKHPAFHPGRCASIFLDGKPAGLIGELHPKWQQHYKLTSAPVIFELDYNLLSQRTLPAFKALSKFQPVSRDLAFLVDEKMASASLTNGLEKIDVGVDKEVSLFDRYVGVGVPEGQKSLAYRIIFKRNQNLTDEHIEEAMQRLVEVATHDFNASLRS